jgi:cytochrome c-type biogenesis protein CcmE
LLWIGVLLLGLALVAGLVIKAFEQNMMFFFSTTEVVEGKAPIERDFRVGGMVVEGSVQRDTNTLKVQFNLTDYQTPLTVEYQGILPDLFREGQGIVAKGRLNAEGLFVASEVLAKHDENYMPPEVAASLKQQGQP